MSVGRYFRDKVRGAKIIHQGHSKFSGNVRKALEDRWGQKVHVFTVLRDPIKHTQSLYSYMKHSRGHPKYALGQRPFDEWARNLNEFPYYVKFFGEGDTDAALEVLSQFDTILDTSSLSADIREMLVSLGLKPKPMVHINRRPTITVGPDGRRLIRKLRQKDYDLLNKLDKRKHIKRS